MTPDCFHSLPLKVRLPRMSVAYSMKKRTSRQLTTLFFGKMCAKEKSPFEDASLLRRTLLLHPPLWNTRQESAGADIYDSFFWRKASLPRKTRCIWTSFFSPCHFFHISCFQCWIWNPKNIICLFNQFPTFICSHHSASVCAECQLALIQGRGTLLLGGPIATTTTKTLPISDDNPLGRTPTVKKARAIMK